MRPRPNRKQIAALVLTLALASAALLADALKPLLAALPIALVLALMIGRRWSGPRAGLAGWLAGVAVGATAFGLTFDVWWVSQAKGLLLSLIVLWVLWPALVLYQLVDGVGGIRALAGALERLIGERGLLAVVMAWAFSGMLEGLAGFGIPIAIVAPMLVGLGVAPVAAVAAVAVGHAWSVTFGDMGVIYETLIRLVAVDEAHLARVTAGLLGAAVLLTGLSAARILGQMGRWRAVVVLAPGISLAQYGLVMAGLAPLAAFGAGLAGVALAVLISRARAGAARLDDSPALRGAAASYGLLAALLAAIALIGPLYARLASVAWSPEFPAVETRAGFAIAAAGQTLRPLVHPGTAILLVAGASAWAFRQAGLAASGNGQRALRRTVHTAAPATAGIVAMVGLSTLMEYTGMTQLLAETTADLLDRAFPLFSPLVGMLGAFATGSNNNSNVLFAGLQEQVARLLEIAPAVLVAAQTAGGSLGSMIAPAKIIVGCSTTGLQGRDGEVLRVTLPYGVAIGAALGAITLVLAWL